MLTTAPRVQRDRRYSSMAWRRARDTTLSRDAYTCQGCGRMGRAGDRWLVADHKVPPHRYPGAFADLDNLWCLCKACNNSKGDQTVEEWRARAERPCRHPYAMATTPPRPSPLIILPVEPAPMFAYHLHRWGRQPWQTTFVGNMSRRWPMDESCPPDCTAYRREPA